MSFASLEREILAHTRKFLHNPKIKLSDLLEWRTAELKPEAANEIVFQLQSGIWVCVDGKLDQRPKEGS